MSKSLGINIYKNCSVISGNGVRDGVIESCTRTLTTNFYPPRMTTPTTFSYSSLKEASEISENHYTEGLNPYFSPYLAKNEGFLTASQDIDISSGIAISDILRTAIRKINSVKNKFLNRYPEDPNLCLASAYSVPYLAKSDVGVTASIDSDILETAISQGRVLSPLRIAVSENRYTQEDKSVFTCPGPKETSESAKFDRPVRYFARNSSIDPYQMSLEPVLLVLNEVRIKSSFERDLESRICSELDYCGFFSSVWACSDPSHQEKRKVIPNLCGLPVCSRPECRKKRYNEAYGRLKSVTSGFNHNSNSLHRTSKNPSFIVLTFKSHKSLSKSERRKCLKCVRLFCKRFNLKGVLNLETKFQSDGLYYYHVNLLCDNDYIDKFSSLVPAWELITKREMGVKSSNVWINKSSLKGCLNYIAHRIGSPLIELYDRSESGTKKELSVRKTHNKRLIRQYVCELRNQNSFIVFGYSLKERRLMLTGKFKNTALLCKICHKHFVCVAVMPSSELPFYVEQNKKIEVIEWLFSDSHLSNLNFNRGVVV